MNQISESTSRVQVDWNKYSGTYQFWKSEITGRFWKPSSCCPALYTPKWKPSGAAIHLVSNKLLSALASSLAHAPPLGQVLQNLDFFSVALLAGIENISPRAFILVEKKKTNVSITFFNCVLCSSSVYWYIVCILFSFCVSIFAKERQGEIFLWPHITGTFFFSFFFSVWTVSCTTEAHLEACTSLAFGEKISRIRIQESNSPRTFTKGRLKVSRYFG